MPESDLPSLRTPHSALRTGIKGWLFDIDDLGPAVTLWVYDDDGHLHRLSEEFRAPIYAHDPGRTPGCHRD